MLCLDLLVTDFLYVEIIRSPDDRIVTVLLLKQHYFEVVFGRADFGRIISQLQFGGDSVPDFLDLLTKFSAGSSLIIRVCFLSEVVKCEKIVMASLSFRILKSSM